MGARRARVFVWPSGLGWPLEMMTNPAEQYCRPATPFRKYHLFPIIATFPQLERSHQ